MQGNILKLCLTSKLQGKHWLSHGFHLAWVQNHELYCLLVLMDKQLYVTFIFFDASSFLWERIVDKKINKNYVNCGTLSNYLQSQFHWVNHSFISNTWPYFAILPGMAITGLSSLPNYLWHASACPHLTSGIVQLLYLIRWIIINYTEIQSHQWNPVTGNWEPIQGWLVCNGNTVSYITGLNYNWSH